MALTIGQLPFHERPVRELLNLVGERDAPDHDYAGHGWARVPRVWLGHDAGDAGTGRLVADALVLALHSPDDAEPLTDDVELELDLPDGSSVLVLLSRFLAAWLPRLPRASVIVLALCNPYRATPRPPANATAPICYARGDVTSWLDRDRGDRVELLAESWETVGRMP
ncbi:MAG TPA: hypothetical protein VF516_22845 [Kofleriaceae bacterium]